MRETHVMILNMTSVETGADFGYVKVEIPLWNNSGGSLSTDLPEDSSYSVYSNIVNESLVRTHSIMHEFSKYNYKLVSEYFKFENE